MANSKMFFSEKNIRLHENLNFYVHNVVLDAVKVDYFSVSPNNFCQKNPRTFFCISHFCKAWPMHN